MASELVNAATSEKLTEIDWTKNIEICELVARDHRQAKGVIKAIKKRLGSKNSDTQLFAVLLLEMLLNNIGEPVHKQVIDTGLIPILVKIVKKKSDLPVGEKIFLLLDAAQTSVGGASGRFPQYYSAYYELVSVGVQFPQRAVQPLPNGNKSFSDNELEDSQSKNDAEGECLKVPESSVLPKAETALEVLRDVLDAVDTRHPEAGKDEFTLDLVEQCSFQKQRVMHLALTSRDDKVVSQAIQLNEHLGRVLARHQALISSSPTSVSNLLNHDREEDEEEAEQLFRRLRKGKAHIGPEDEDHLADRPLRLVGAQVPGEALHRPLIKPLAVAPKQEKDTIPPAFAVEPRQEQDLNRSAFVIPPPPAKYAERAKFFQENKLEGSSLSGRMKGLSLHNRNASSSRSGSVDFNDLALS